MDGDFQSWFSSSRHWYSWLEYHFAQKRRCPIKVCSKASWISISPRWLVEKGHYVGAQTALAYIRDADPESDIVSIELEAIRANVEDHRNTFEEKWTSLFTHRPIFNRLWRAALLQFMAQMCGNTAMKYYLPSIFASLGIEHRLTLLIGGIESTLKIGCTIIEMLIIDRVGRKTTLVIGCVVMGIALLVSFL